MSIAIVGATGLVGRTMLGLIEDAFPEQQIFCVASQNSRSQRLPSVRFGSNKHYVLLGLDDLVKEPSLDVVLWAADADSSRKYAPIFAERGVYVVDNSTAWRMDPAHKLIVPEINISTLKSDDYIIANPNCSTIQLAVPLYPLHQRFGIKRLVVSTYQSVSGSGLSGVEQLKAEKAGMAHKRFYKHPILANVIAAIDEFREDGYTKEEEKMMLEFGKIIGDNSVKITATAVRVPVFVGHSESVNITFKNMFALSEIHAILADAPGVKLVDDPMHEMLTPKYVEGNDLVYVGRIRHDSSLDYSLNMWIVSDNIRKGAATNAVQIVQWLFENNWIS